MWVFIATCILQMRDALFNMNNQAWSAVVKTENVIMEHTSSYPELFMQFPSVVQKSLRTYIFGTATHHDPVFRAVLPPTTVSRLELASRTTSAHEPTISNMVITGTDRHESDLVHLEFLIKICCMMIMLLAVALVISSILSICHHWRMASQLSSLEKTMDQLREEIREMQKIPGVEKVPAKEGSSSGSSGAAPATDDSASSAPAPVAFPAAPSSPSVTAAAAPSGDAPSGDAHSGDASSGDASSGDAPSGDAPTVDAPIVDAPTVDAPAPDAAAPSAPAAPVVDDTIGSSTCTASNSQEASNPAASSVPVASVPGGSTESSSRTAPESEDIISDVAALAPKANTGTTAALETPNIGIVETPMITESHEDISNVATPASKESISKKRVPMNAAGPKGSAPLNAPKAPAAMIRTQNGWRDKPRTQQRENEEKSAIHPQVAQEKSITQQQGAEEKNTAQQHDAEEKKTNQQQDAEEKNSTQPEDAQEKSAIQSQVVQEHSFTQQEAAPDLHNVTAASAKVSEDHAEKTNTGPHFFSLQPPTQAQESVVQEQDAEQKNATQQQDAEEKSSTKPQVAQEKSINQQQAAQASQSVTTAQSNVSEDQAEKPDTERRLFFLQPSTPAQESVVQQQVAEEKSSTQPPNAQEKSITQQQPAQGSQNETAAQAKVTEDQAEKQNTGPRFFFLQSPMPADNSVAQQQVTRASQNVTAGPAKAPEDQAEKPTTERRFSFLQPSTPSQQSDATTKPAAESQPTTEMPKAPKPSTNVSTQPLTRTQEKAPAQDHHPVTPQQPSPDIYQDLEALQALNLPFKLVVLHPPGKDPWMHPLTRAQKNIVDRALKAQSSGGAQKKNSRRGK